MNASESPYDLPIFRDSFSASSPDGCHVASINPACEVSMSNPTYGTLCLSAGLHLEWCNPSFLWDSTSRYLAVPQFFRRLGVFRLQRLLIIDVVVRRVFASHRTAYYFQPESFVAGHLVVTVNPFRRASQLAWQVPDAFGSAFSYRPVVWAREGSA